VYKGTDRTSNKIVAIKMLSKSTINSDEYLKQGLFEEIKVM